MAAAITSITGLQNLINLNNFNADFNGLQSVNLSGLTNLLYVDISDNNIPGTSTNSLTSVNLSGCTALQSLRLDDSDFSAGIPSLAGLTSLSIIDFDQCSISGVVDLSGLPALTDLDFGGNTALTSIIIADAQPIIEFYASDCALTEVSVNDILQWLDGNSEIDGYLNFTGGTNALPTGAGITAYNNLTAKGWTIDPS